MDNGEIVDSGVYENINTQYYEYWIIDGDYREIVGYSHKSLGVIGIEEMSNELRIRWSNDEMSIALENTKIFNKYSSIYAEYVLDFILPIHDDDEFEM